MAFFFLTSESESPTEELQFQRVHKVLHKELRIRVGGSFVWPPPEIDTNHVQKVVFVAGGVGIKYVFA